jgi:outer membrane protein assembly factor BamB
MSQISIVTEENIGNTLEVVDTKLQVNIDNDTIKKNDNGELYTESPNVTVTMVAGEVLSGGMLVYIGGDGKIYKFNASDVSLNGKSLGFTNHSSIVDQPTTVVKSGKCIELGGLQAGLKYFAGNSGGVVSTPPTIGIRQVVGTAESATIMLVGIQESFIKIAD